MVLVSVLVLIVLGVTGFNRMVTDFLPKMELPYMLVLTTYPGASPQKIEKEITDPVENNLSTINGVKNVISTSSENASRVMLEFEDNTNMDSAMIKATTALNQIDFPETAAEPMIMEISMDMLPVSYVSVDYKGKTGGELSSYIEENVVPELKRQDGVASVQSSGMVKDSVQVKLDKDKVNALNQDIYDSAMDKLDEAREGLDSAQSALNEGKSKLDAQERKLNKQEKKTAKQTAKYSKLMDEAVATKQAMNSQYQSLKIYSAALKAEKSAYEQQMEAMGEQIKLLPQDNPARQAYDKMSARVEQINVELANLKTEITASKMANDKAKGQINKATKNYEKVESGKMTAAVAFGSGKAQLASARKSLQDSQKEIDDGYASFEENREQVAENANADDLLSLDTLKAIITAQNFSMPAGYVMDDTMQYLLKIDEETNTVDGIKNLALTHIDGVGDIRLKDVADVRIVNNSSETYAKVNGNDAAVLAIFKASSAGTSAVSERLTEAEAKLEKENKGLHFTSLMDQGDYIGIIIKSVFTNLISGALLAILILLLFLRSIRPTVVVALAIPLSVLFAILAMYFTDVTMNIISLSGLALGIGMLVDNAIVVTENIYRLKAQGVSSARAAVIGARQVAGAIVASTLTTVCVFVPILFTDGLTREMMMDMCLTITYSLFASLIVALSVVPSLSSTLLRNAQPKPDPVMDRIKEKYEIALRFCLRRKYVPIAIALVLLILCAAKVFSTGVVILPEMASHQMSMQVQAKQDQDVDDDFDMMDRITKKVRKIKGVETVGAVQAATIRIAGGSDKQYTAMVLLNEDYADQNYSIAEKIEKILEKENLESYTVQASNMDTSQLFGEGLEVNVFGDNEDRLMRISKDVMKMARDIKGFENIDNGQNEREKELVLNIDKVKAIEKGLTVAQVYQALQEKLTTEEKATTVENNGSNIDVNLVDKRNKLTKNNLMDFEIEVQPQGGAQSSEGQQDQGDSEYSGDTQEGGSQTQSEETETVRLGDIATVREKDSVTDIQHDNGSREIQVTADTKEGYNTTLLSREMQKKIDDYNVPKGYKVEIAGEVESVNKMVHDMLLMILVAIILVYLIMVAQFANFLSPFIVMFTIPLAFTGGFLALMITGSELSIIALMGFLILAGVVVNNGIVFIDYANRLRRAGMEKRQALVETGKARMRPILMTSLTTVLAMSVMAVSRGQGAEMGRGMAIVTIGGLLYATLMTLFIVPVMYDTIYRKKELKVVDLGDESTLDISQEEEDRLMLKRDDQPGQSGQFDQTDYADHSVHVNETEKADAAAPARRRSALRSMQRHL